MKATLLKPASTLVASALVTSCAANSQMVTQKTDPIRVDGSSTVAPITQLAADEFKASHSKQTEVSINTSGTGGGFKKFCSGETDINNASRPILIQEMDACKQTKVAYLEIPIAFDAITVVVNPQNTWAKDMTSAELRKLWEPDAEEKITNWRQIRSSYPDRPIALYAPGQNSGTFDYFTQIVNGSGGASRKDYSASKEANDLAQNVIRDPNAIAYFGFGYYQADAKQLKPLAINSGQGAVLPSVKTVQSAKYQPLSRPLFIYVNLNSAQKKPQVKAFVEAYLKNADRHVKQTGYIPLPSQGYQLALNHFHEGKVGTVFAGKLQPGITITQLLAKEAVF
ncbi:MAG: PstS family phosphate ABC transporter substrate-binding protein [Tildeniella nuda ZEHNDER 1965/U140]|jgi:phosphate transport system substrate-binding protein|nr:PstS family phosphate ABC transporter substrate-binding protein [Tildeniella nuda ZEHNDER 1965/U140]